jgi:hypothetical protein
VLVALLEHLAVAAELLLDRPLDLLQFQLGRKACDIRHTLAPVALLDADVHLAAEQVIIVLLYFACTLRHNF